MNQTSLIYTVTCSKELRFKTAKLKLLKTVRMKT
jgi:hypothetical protein